MPSHEVQSRRLPVHRASTRFLRVPTVDWPAVRIGAKTEFRTKPRESSRLITCHTPTPVVAYATFRAREPQTKLMVLMERRWETLFDISDNPDALAREGFESYDHFRRYWRRRLHGRYAPMDRVWVWRVRPWEPADTLAMGAELIEELYGEHLPQ